MLYHLYISLTAITMAFSVLKLDISNSRSSTELNKDSDDHDSQDQGGFTYDKLSEVFTLQWPTMQDFTGWLEEEQRRNCYELNLQKKDKGTRFSCKFRYVCGRKRTGGEKMYTKLNPNRSRKVNEPKLIGCPCTLIVKTYPNTETVLGYFTHKHSHPLGEENLKFTYIPTAARERMQDMIRQHVDVDYIVSHTFYSSAHKCCTYISHPRSRQ